MRELAQDEKLATGQKQKIGKYLRHAIPQSSRDPVVGRGGGLAGWGGPFLGDGGGGRNLIIFSQALFQCVAGRQQFFYFMQERHDARSLWPWVARNLG